MEMEGDVSDKAEIDIGIPHDDSECGKVWLYSWIITFETKRASERRRASTASCVAPATASPAPGWPG